MRVKGIFAAPFLLIVVLALWAIAGFLDAETLGVGVSPYLALVIVQFIVYALPSVFFCRLRGKEYTPRLRLRLVKPGHVFLLLSALTAMLSGSALLNLSVITLFPHADFGTAVSRYGSVGGGADSMLYVLLALCILPALLEEFLFRGIIVSEYESVSVPTAVFLSALLFALMHMSYARLPAYFFSGVVLCLTLYATRSLLAPMLVHACNNVAALFLDRYLYAAVPEIGERSVLLVFILFCVLFVSLICFALSAQNIYTAYGVTNTPSPHIRKKKRGETGGFFAAVGAPPFVLLIVLFVIFTAVS